METMPRCSRWPTSARWLSRTAKVLSGSAVPVSNYDPSRHGDVVSFDGLDGYDEVDRYLAQRPFAFASINHDPEANEHYYHVVEPTLDEFERDLLDRLFEDVRDPLIYRADVDEVPEDALIEELRARIEEYGVLVEPGDVLPSLLLPLPLVPGYGRIDPLMHDPTSRTSRVTGRTSPSSRTTTTTPTSRRTSRSPAAN